MTTGASCRTGRRQVRRVSHWAKGSSRCSRACAGGAAQPDLRVEITRRRSHRCRTRAARICCSRTIGIHSSHETEARIVRPVKPKS